MATMNPLCCFWTSPLSCLSSFSADGLTCQGTASANLHVLPFFPPPTMEERFLLLSQLNSSTYAQKSILSLFSKIMGYHTSFTFTLKLVYWKMSCLTRSSLPISILSVFTIKGLELYCAFTLQLPQIPLIPQKFLQDPVSKVGRVKSARGLYGNSACELWKGEEAGYGHGMHSDGDANLKNS